MQNNNIFHQKIEEIYFWGIHKETSKDVADAIILHSHTI